MSKAIRPILFTLFSLAWMCATMLAQGGVTHSTKNPKQIATLHWYPANLAASFSVPRAVDVLFDGTNIWVGGVDHVSKIRPSDGAVLGVFGPFSAGPFLSMAFDGTNLWITAAASNILEKVRASDGTLVHEYSGGGQSILFDGTNIWWTNGNKVSNLAKVRPSDGARLAIFDIGPGVCPGTSGLAFDGANIWVAYSGCDINGAPLHTVTKLRGSDGAVLGTFPVGNTPFGVVFDGANIWVSNTGDNTVTKLRSSDGALLGTFPAGTMPGNMAFDGANIWIANQGAVTKLRARDGALLGTFPGGSFEFGMAFDGTNVWATEQFGNGSAIVSKF